jgi:hypothetical protein
MKLASLIFFLFIALFLYGQTGIKALTFVPKNRIVDQMADNTFFPYIPGVGMDYWLRLKKYRLEILPAIHAFYGSEPVKFDDALKGKLYWSLVEFSPAIQFYPLDFVNDCQCPTFSKQGQFLKKGVFIQVAPGLSYSLLHLPARGNDMVQTTAAKASDISYFARLGIGIDIGLSNLLTLSPTWGYQWASPLDWSEIFTSPSANSINVYSGMMFQMRLGWRFDRKNY